MNNLNQLLRDASEPRDQWSLDPVGLVETGRARVRRRRSVVAAAVGVTAVTATFALATPLQGDDRSQVVNDPSTIGEYRAEEISPAEVRRRCAVALDYDAPADQIWVTQEGPALVGSTVSTYQATEESTDGTVLAQDCVVPQEQLADQVFEAMQAPLPQTQSTQAVRNLCERRAGYDLNGWSATAIDQRGPNVAAVFRSTNGYRASCLLTDDGTFEFAIGRT